MIRPPANITSPSYVHKLVQLLQSEFSTGLTWLNRCFAITLRGVTDEGTHYPQIYNPSTGLNEDIRPDVDVSSYAFFETDEFEIPDYNESIEETYNLSVTFWGNLKQIDSTKNYDFTSDLYKEVIAILKSTTSYRDEAINVKVYINPEDVYSKYNDLIEKNTQFLMRPYTYFKITFSIDYKGRC